MRFKNEVLAFAKDHLSGFRPRDLLKFLRDQGGLYPSTGGNTAKIYVAINKLVKEGKLEKITEPGRTRNTSRYKITEGV